MRRPRILSTDSVVIVKRSEGGVDDDGVPTSTVERIPWDYVNVQRLTSTELTDQGRNTTEVVYRVAGDPPSRVVDDVRVPVTIDSEDRIEWLGDEYLIDGEPDVRTGRGRIEYTGLTMTRVRG